ncbi:NBS-LRR type resistance protein [Cucumis melo var. makuwa]|uniref:NBS-LRR type resistance protein n=1 Tax=Cucumis melo var. makuwa TaxID=1194695 RepID=A0A5A7UXM5_CUCMM|nr:NBS-LRR type resistance protein [Cucumis melo var. makuwa]TYJ99796.1 NBS-LRR type resistance protein [Cucumis melo var. makuwa]
MRQRKHKETRRIHMAFTYPSCPSPVCPSPYYYLKSLKRKRNAHINQSSDPVGCTYQSSDLEGCTYRSSDPKACTYQSSDPEGCTYHRVIPKDTHISLVIPKDTVPVSRIQSTAQFNNVYTIYTRGFRTLSPSTT